MSDAGHQVPPELIEQLINELDPANLSAEAFAKLLAGVSGIKLDLSGVSPRAFAKLISKASDAQIRAVVAQADIRNQVLDEIFRRMRSQFRADRGARAEAVVHWQVGDRPDGGSDEYQMVIENGSCTVTKALDREPRVTLSMGAFEFIKLVSGNGSPAMMFLTGRLKIRGDRTFAVNMLGLFRIPKP